MKSTYLPRGCLISSLSRFEEVDLSIKCERKGSKRIKSNLYEYDKECFLNFKQSHAINGDCYKEIYTCVYKRRHM